MWLDEHVEVAEARNARRPSSLTLHAANGISLLIVALNAIKTEFLATNENGLRKNWIYDFYKRFLKKELFTKLAIWTDKNVSL